MPTLHMPMHMSGHMSTHMSLHMAIHISMNKFIHMPKHVSMHMSTPMFTRMTTHTVDLLMGIPLSSQVINNSEAYPFNKHEGMLVDVLRTATEDVTSARAGCVQEVYVATLMLKRLCYNA